MTKLDWADYVATTRMRFDQHFFGVAIIESLHMTKSKVFEYNRSWKERIFSWPWRPWAKVREEIIQIPVEEVLMIGNNMAVCHPAIARLLRDSIA